MSRIVPSDRRAVALSRWGALCWGFAEATLFFVVPDVLITALALDNLRRALIACLFALAGALVGGAVMHEWAEARYEQAWRAVERVPSVSVEMLDSIEASLEDRGARAMIGGAFIGRPYKAYALQAPGAGLGLLPFLVATVPARLFRFVLAAIGTSALATLAKSWSRRRKRLVLAGFWVILYALFWTLIPN